MSRGRKPGYTHSEETKEKIRRSHLGNVYTEAQKANISRGLALYKLDEKCIRRYEELKANYPEQEAFFVDNRDALLFAMEDVRTEKELSDVRRYIETAELRPDATYHYSSSSCYAAEDDMIQLLDIKRFLQKYH